MTGGSRPPAPKPEDWLKSLPIAPNESLEQTFIIFDGMINDLTNVVYHINGTRLSVVTKSGEGYWCFNTVSGEFEVAQSEGTGWGNMAINKSGHDSWSQSNVYPVESLDRSQVTWRLVEV